MFVLLALCALAPALAQGDFAPATLVSGTQAMQFRAANAPAISGDGRYVAFMGTIADSSGVFVRDLQSGEVVPVAATASATDGVPAALSAPDAAAPSISVDGRYIAFTTTADLEPLSESTPGHPQGEPPVDRGCPEVYVRDMEKAPGEAGAYTLVAALDGSAEGIAFAGPCQTLGSGFYIEGAQAAPAAAISADGRHVAFTLLSPSNLTTGFGGALTTPPDQVLVRDLDTQSTTLATANAAGQPVAAGGAYATVQAGRPFVELEYYQPSFGDEATASTAVLSADASSVAWLGTNTAEQISPAEAEREPHTGVEPLWRRIADGPHAITRRLLAGSGLDFETSYGVSSIAPGSLAGIQSPVFVPPALSADGSTAAVIASAPAPAALASLAGGVGANIAELRTDAYVVRIGDDPAIPPATSPITEISTYAAPETATDDVKDVAVSPDGTRVAFDTSRLQLTLPGLSLVSPPATGGDPEIYEADLVHDTLRRVIATYGGSEPNGAAGLLSFAQEARTLAFASQATDLFFGDGVAGSEVYLTHELGSEASLAQETTGGLPPSESVSPEWDLSATATAQADGSVVVDAQVPGPGKLDALARAQLPALQRAGKSGSARRAHGRSAAGTRLGAHLQVTHVRLLTRAVARGGLRAGGPAELRLHLRLDGSYRGLLARRDGLYAILRITFVAAGHKNLEQTIPVTFQRWSRCGSRPCDRAARRGAGDRARGAGTGGASVTARRPSRHGA